MKLIGLCVGRSRHARQFPIQTEIILKGDGGHGLVLSLNRHTLFGFNRLVQTIAPTATRHQTTGELVNDDNLAVLVHVMLIAVVEMLGTQCCIQMVYQANMHGVIQRRSLGQQAHLREHFLRFFMTQFSQVHLMRFFVEGEVPGLGDALACAQI